MFTWPILVATTMLGAPLSAAEPVTPPPGRRAAEDSLSTEEILAKYQKQRQQPNTEPSEKQRLLKVRMECLVKLMKIGPAAVPALIDCLKDEKAPSYTRALAAQALGLLGDVRARPILLQAIEDKAGAVQEHAQIALGRLGRLEATPKLLKLAGKDEATTGKRYIELMFAMTRDDEPNPERIRKALRGYDVARMGSAQLGKSAPDFTLADASGKTWRLRQFRDKKAVVLIFLQSHF